MEDVQPNELRMSRKGSARVPTVRSSHRGASWRGYRGRAQLQRTPEDNTAKRSQPWRSPAPSKQRLTAQPPPRLLSHERRSYSQGSKNQAGMVAHFNQPPRRAEPGGVSVPPVNCQQDFSSLGKPRRDSKRLDIGLSSECLGGALEGSQPAREEWVSEKRTQLFDRDRGSSVNGFQCGDPDPNTLFSRANHNRICGHTEDHSLRRAVHSPAHGVDRNGHPSEGQTHPAVYSSSRIQPSSPQTAKVIWLYISL
ncbi:hypothetical protein EDD15DRAFT_2220358 [Pisolithus albus]|nr:hypothetical protein EDD15DRAFT_2220358 [Pisolithus albus]